MALIHILDKQNDAIVGTLNVGEYYDDFKISSLDSQNTFDFIALKHFDKLQKRNRLLLQNRDGFFDEYIIEHVDQFSRKEKQVNSNASFIDLRKAKIIEPQTLEGATADTATDLALLGTEWKKGRIDYAGIRTIHIEDYTDPYILLKKIASEFGLQLRFRIEIVDGNKIERYVDLLLPDEDFDGKEVEFGKDLVEVRRIEDAQNIVTALLVLGPQQEDGTRMSVLVEDTEALQRWSRNGQHLIEVYEPQITSENVTVQRLRILGENELKKRVDAIVKYECQAAIIDHIHGKEHEKVSLGDTIRIKDTGYLPPLYLEAKVLQTKEQPSTNKLLDFTLGNYIEYSEEDLKAQISALRKQLNERFSKLVQVTVTSSAGTVFKNGEGETTLTATTFLNGQEVDEEGTQYEYIWTKYDKNGNFVGATSGKSIAVYARNIDEKETYIVTVENEGAKSIGQITVTNVYDGEDGKDGEPGPPGPKGDKGDPGPQGPAGTSVSSITEYYLATHLSSGVTTGTSGWTTAMQQMTSTKKYLWNYEKINFSDGSYQNTNPVIIGVYGDKGEKGDTGATGRSITRIKEYYLASNQSSGVTRSTSGWTTTMQVTTPSKKYLWNYEEITWSSSPTVTYTDPVIIGVHGEQGPKGEDGKTFYTWIKYADTPTSGMSDNPEGKEYIGIAYNKETPTPSTNYSDYVWNKFKGDQGIPGPPGKDGQPTYTWVKYADDDKGSGMSDSPEGKRYLGLAFNKTTPNESNNPSDYSWSPLYDNVKVGGRNLLEGIWDLTWEDTYGSYEYLLRPRIESILPKVEVGDEITFSFDVEAESNTSLKIYDSNGHPGISFGNETVIVKKGKQRVSFTKTLVTGDRNTSQWYMDVYNYNNGVKFSISKIKIEKGNVATDWTPAPEDIEAEIEKAKQDAQNAQSTADGKNTVFRQSTRPSTVGRKVGDLWFDTANGNKIHVFNGSSWVEAKLDHQALNVGKLSAISADLGNVTAGHMQGVTLNLANGKFVVDANGNVYFAGDLNGASGSFKGNLTTSKLTIGQDQPTPAGFSSDGSAMLEIKMPERVSDGVYRWMDPFIIKLLNGTVIFDQLNSLDVRGTVLADVLSGKVNASEIRLNNTHLISYITNPQHGNQGIRFANGVQLCWGWTAGTITAGKEWGIPFPQQFIDSNYVFIPMFHSAFDRNDYAIIKTKQLSTTQAVIRFSYVYDINPSTTHYVQWMAAGRWKL